MTDWPSGDPNTRRRLVEVATAALARALTIEDVIAALTDKRILGPLGGAALALYLAEQKGLRRFATVDLQPDRIRAAEYGHQFPMDESVPFHAPFPMTTAFKTQKALFIHREEVRQEFPVYFRSYVEPSDLTFGCFLPLVAQGTSVGVLAIGWRDKSGYAVDERPLLLTLATAVAQSVKRAGLYDQEHATAVALQQSMLPSRLPEVSGVRVAARYRSAGLGSRIGGDWYDAFLLPHGRVGLIIGDVQGHEIHAAAIMGQLRTALRAYAILGEPPDALIARVDTFLADLDTDRFATCLYAELDPATGRTWIVRAGHHGPVLRRSDGTTSQPDLRGGPPLGLPFHNELGYPVNELQIGIADTLLLCTDGLLQFHDKDVDVGLRQVERLLGAGTGDPERLADQIIGPVDTANALDDDVAFLLVTRTASSA